MRAHRWYCLGAIGDACARSSDPRRPRLRVGTFVPSAIWVRVRCLLHQREAAAAEAVLAQVSPRRPRAFGDSPLGLTPFSAGRRQLSKRDVVAFETWQEAGALAAATGVHNPAFFPWRPGAALAAAGREIDEARRLADAEVVAASASDVPRTLGIALTARGIVERSQALEPTRAVAVLEETPAWLDLARAPVEQGIALLVSGRGSTPASRCAAACTSPIAAALRRSPAARATSSWPLRPRADADVGRARR